VRLLVSVATPADAAAAVAGGADVVDAKDPSRGALGAVTLAEFRGVCDAVNGAAPVSAALGDALDEPSIARDARAFARAGSAFVKVGFARVAVPARVKDLLDAALQATPDVVAVAYADGACVGSAHPVEVIGAAARARARGVLIDTADKRGPGLTALVAARDLAAWIRCAQRDALHVAIAGKLTATDIEALLSSGADIVGVRSAVCDGGRTGPVSSRKVHALQQLLRRGATPCSATPHARSAAVI
jgi:uncharacterized protein (UPF0264 family)